MDKNVQKIIVESERSDICVNTFTKLVPYFSKFNIKLILEMFEEYKRSSEERKEYPEWSDNKNSLEIQREEKYIELMEKYIRSKEDGQLFLKPEEDAELFRLHNRFVDFISSQKLDKKRKRYRAELKLAIEFKEQMENGIIVFDDPELDDVLPNTKEWINFLIKFLQHPSEVTEDDLDLCPLVDETMFIESISSMQEAYKVYKKETELPPNTESLDEYAKNRGAPRTLEGQLAEYPDLGNIIRHQFKTKAKIDALFEEDVTKEVAEELRRILGELKCFSEKETDEWRDAIERGERKNMKKELQEVLGILRRKLQREQLQEEYIAEAKKCEQNIAHFGSEMRKKMEKIQRDEELQRAEELRGAFEEEN